MTKAEMRKRVLQHLGRLAATEEATAEDAVIVDEAIDGAHARLEHLGIAPFETSNIPSWAQVPFRNFVAGDLVSTFGLDGQAISLHAQLQARGLQELREQTEARWDGHRVQARYY